MRQVTPMTVSHVISEPGDATRYDYIVLQNEDEFYFIPFGSTFKFPHVIDRFDVPPKEDVKWDNEYVQEIAKKHNCNPHTIVECVNQIYEMERM